MRQALTRLEARHDLDGRGTCTNDCNCLVPKVVVRVPPRGVQRFTLELIQTVDLRPLPLATGM